MKKEVSDIISELRSYDATPPPKGVWLDIADRLEKAVVDEPEGSWAELENVVQGYLRKTVLDLPDEQLDTEKMSREICKIVTREIGTMLLMEELFRKDKA